MVYDSLDIYLIKYVIENIHVVTPIMLMILMIHHHPNPMCYPDISLQKLHPII